MPIRHSALLISTLMIFFFAGGCSKSEPSKQAASPQAPADSAVAEGKALFEKKCGVCHGIGKATARKATKEQWSEIVKSMQGKKADWISDAEASKILEFLAAEHGIK